MNHRVNLLSFDADEAETGCQSRELPGPRRFPELDRKSGHGSELEGIKTQVAFMVNMAKENSSDPWGSLKHLEETGGVLQHEFV